MGNVDRERKVKKKKNPENKKNRIKNKKKSVMEVGRNAVGNFTGKGDKTCSGN